jgi:hypothetical protein
MKFTSCLILLISLSSFASGKDSIYEGSTPAGQDVRKYLGISLNDSIDFIRWKLVINADHYELQCQYGISKPNTSGFIDERRVAFSGKATKKDNHYYLDNQGKVFSLLVINPNLLHPLDKKGNMLVGNGGFSYTLSRNEPTKTSQFNLPPDHNAATATMTFEGRTPCRELSDILGLDKGSACFKLKWYFIFMVDSVTGKPSGYLTGGTISRKETMNKGKWQITRKKDGRTIYKLEPPKSARPIYLLKAGDNILYFTDPEGNLLVGNKDFSYTLNRKS